MVGTTSSERWLEESKANPLRASAIIVFANGSVSDIQLDFCLTAVNAVKQKAVFLRRLLIFGKAVLISILSASVLGIQLFHHIDGSLNLLNKSPISVDRRWAD